MHMPETPMDEDSRLVFSQDNIRGSRQCPHMKPIPEAQPMEHLPDNPLRSGVSAANARHIT